MSVSRAVNKHELSPDDAGVQREAYLHITLPGPSRQVIGHVARRDVHGERGIRAPTILPWAMIVSLHQQVDNASPGALTQELLLGAEAVALGAIHAGISIGYAYPGTPSTEIFEYLLDEAGRRGHPKAAWCVNEKTAYEQALGVSMAGRRCLVVMKHVGLNVAADPFINSALISIKGGLVLAVADDPGMHSSENEQDSRYYADFARILCLEPSTQQEAYDMSREAFDLSERFHIPVVVRLVTRLAHTRALVETGDEREERALDRVVEPTSWILLPSNARILWRQLIRKQEQLKAYTEDCRYNTLTLSEGDRGLGVITTGIARSYYLENLQDLGFEPSHLHVGAYPSPMEKIRALGDKVKTILVLEEGYPFLERYLRGIFPIATEIRGVESGDIPPDGELTPDIVRNALGLPPSSGVEIPDLSLPRRPPQLCPGCPHLDSYDALTKALAEFQGYVVCGDIGCYTLGALPPYSAIESCVCMGASVGMAKGAADAGLRPVLAVIGDGTFLHSGITPMIDAVAADTDMTVVILDNQAIAMTGAQQTVLDSSRLRPLILSLGLSPAHCHVLKAHPRNVKRMAQLIRKEVEHQGLSVIISVRECVERTKRRKAALK